MSEVFVIGIAGGTGSGKTTLADGLVGKFSEGEVASVSHDSYYRDLSGLSDDERVRVNYDHPDSLETSLLVEHVTKLKSGEKVEVPEYDFSIHNRKSDVRVVEPRPVLVVEGILVLESKELRELMDLRVFVDTEADIRFIRRLERDVKERGRTVESVVRQYMETVRPMHEEFVEPSKRHADVIVPEGGANVRAVELFLSIVEKKLKI